MKELKQIYKTLLPTEVGYLQEYYQGRGKRKRLKLLHLLEAPQTPTNALAAAHIYQPGQTASTFTHLKETVKQDMLTLLMLQDIERHSKSAYRQAEISCRKLIVEGDILLKKGVYAPAVKALEKAAKLATTFELINEKIMAEDLIRTHLGFREGLKVYQHYDQSIEDSYTLLGRLLEVKKLYYGILLPNLFATNINSEYIERCRIAHLRMQALYASSQSANVGYYMYLTGVYYYNFISDWEQAGVQAQHLVEIVEKEPAITSFLRIANAELQFAGILMKLYRFEQAAAHAQVAVDIFKGGAMNELVSLEQLFLAGFNARDASIYQSAVARAFAHVKIRSSEMLYGKWMFYKAAAAFIDGELDFSLDTLYADNTLLKDKSGWLFGHRLLEIMILMERKDFDLTDFRIEALRKLLQRQKNKSIIRIKAILHILHLFVRQGYSYKDTLAEAEPQLQLLESNTGDYFWNPMGFEAVRFDSWFRGKVSAKHPSSTTAR